MRDLKKHPSQAQERFVNEFKCYGKRKLIAKTFYKSINYLNDIRTRKWSEKNANPRLVAVLLRFERRLLAQHVNLGVMVIMQFHTAKHTTILCQVRAQLSGQ